MLRSELIRILQETTRDCQRDGEVMIEIVRDRRDEDGFELVNDLCPVIDIGEALGNGEAITLIRIIGDD